MVGITRSKVILITGGFYNSWMDFMITDLVAEVEVDSSCKLGYNYN